MHLPVRLRLLLDSAVTSGTCSTFAAVPEKAFIDSFLSFLLNLDESTESKSGGSGEIPPLRMCLALLGPVVVILLSIKLKLKIETKLLVSLCRSILQLLLAGNIPLSIYLNQVASMT